MSQVERARAFHALHIKGNPVILYNIWDAGTAKVIQECGAKAIATGSWAVAAAHGFSDGEKLPFERVLTNLEEIISAVDLPVTLDMEGGYGKSPDELKNSVSQIIRYGAIGINFEDQIVGGEGLYPIAEQSQRIAAIRQAADSLSIPFFINARTDIFLKAPATEHNEGMVQDALERAKAYADAGASGFFIPGLKNLEWIARLSENAPLPINVMMMATMPSPKQLAEAGVARISYGAMPYRNALDALRDGASKAFAMS